MRSLVVLLTSLLTFFGCSAPELEPYTTLADDQEARPKCSGNFESLSPAGELEDDAFEGVSFMAGSCDEKEGTAVRKAVFRSYVIVTNEAGDSIKSRLHVKGSDVLVKSADGKGLVTIGRMAETDEGTRLELLDGIRLELRVGYGSDLASSSEADWKDHEAEEIHLFL